MQGRSCGPHFSRPGDGTGPCCRWSRIPVHLAALLSALCFADAAGFVQIGGLRRNPDLSPSVPFF